jgi:hypothetical protein
LINKAELWLKRPENGKIRAVGDGLTLVASSGENSTEPTVFSYVNDWAGWKWDYYTHGPREGQLGVSSAYGITDGVLQSCLNPEGAWLPLDTSKAVRGRKILFPNTPLVMHATSARLRSGASAIQIELRGFQPDRRYGKLVVSPAFVTSALRAERPLVRSKQNPGDLP